MTAGHVRPSDGRTVLLPVTNIRVPTAGRRSDSAPALAFLVSPPLSLPSFHFFICLCLCLCPCPCPCLWPCFWLCVRVCLALCPSLQLLFCLFSVSVTVHVSFSAPVAIRVCLSHSISLTHSLSLSLSLSLRLSLSLSLSGVCSEGRGEGGADRTRLWAADLDGGREAVVGHHEGLAELVEVLQRVCMCVLARKRVCSCVLVCVRACVRPSVCDAGRPSVRWTDGSDVRVTKIRSWEGWVRWWPATYVRLTDGTDGRHECRVTNIRVTKIRSW